MKYTFSLNEINKKDTAIAGGKGASLGEMIQAGFPVPPGFVVTPGAFGGRRATLSLNSTGEIMAEFKKLKTKYVAVRSSAMAEDSSNDSWAGQLETYLNVIEKNLLKSIEKCRASIDSPRAVSYRKQIGLKSAKGGSQPKADQPLAGAKNFGGKISVAVVVQKMVESEISGVCFTAHPVTGNKNEMVIEAGYGLGEALVGGKITPDTYIINKKTTGVRHPYLAAKNVQGKQKLSDKQIIKLAELCLKIEKLFKYPQDIEWAFAKGKFYILQSRPITTLDK